MTKTVETGYIRSRFHLSNSKFTTVTVSFSSKPMLMTSLSTPLLPQVPSQQSSKHSFAVIVSTVNPGSSSRAVVNQLAVSLKDIHGGLYDGSGSRWGAVPSSEPRLMRSSSSISTTIIIVTVMVKLTEVGGLYSPVTSILTVKTTKTLEAIPHLPASLLLLQCPTQFGMPLMIDGE
ncbi:hypothetical protein L218DRAFT_1002270 [Marasmius fiardii PR-910]|nr:hypothetical protein L218DRAFT_1002270 [Marasmius fiardii PR-910]